MQRPNTRSTARAESRSPSFVIATLSP
jgi:hypothetical protein